MKKLYILITMMVSVAVTGCATGSNEAYAKAHEAAAARGMAEVAAKADAEKVIAMAIASSAKGCETDACRMGAMMSFANIKAQANAIVQSTAPAIAAPVNEALEWTKTIVGAATNLYSIRIGGAIKLGDMTRGAADKDVVNNAMSTLDIVRNTDTAK